VGHRNRLIQFEQADRSTVDGVFRQQRAALFKTATPALRRGVLVTAQGNMVGIQRRDIQPKSVASPLNASVKRGRSAEISLSSSICCQFAILHLNARQRG
jgi:hypothetical protein